MTDKKDPRDLLVKLGWERWDGNTWKHGDIKMLWWDAVVFELENYRWVQTILFICPDCGYKIAFPEFVAGAEPK